MWLGKLHDKNSVALIRNDIADNGASKAELAVIDTIKGELEAPFYYSVPKTTKLLGISSVSHYDVIARLKGSGFEASPTHFDASSIKTNAGIKDVKKCVVEAHG